VVASENCLEVAVAIDVEARWLESHKLKAEESKIRAAAKDAAKWEQIKASAAAAKARGESRGGAAPPAPAHGQRLSRNLLATAPEDSPLHYQWSRRNDRLAALLQQFVNDLPELEQAARNCPATAGLNYLPLMRLRAKMDDERLRAAVEFVNHVHETANAAIAAMSGARNPAVVADPAKVAADATACLRWIDELPEAERAWHTLAFTPNPVPEPDRIPFKPDMSETTDEYQAWHRSRVAEWRQAAADMRAKADRTRNQIRAVADGIMDVASLPGIDLDHSPLRRLLDGIQNPTTAPDLFAPAKDFFDRLSRRLRLASAPPSAQPIPPTQFRNDDGDSHGEIPEDERLSPGEQAHALDEAGALGVPKGKPQARRLQKTQEVRDAAKTAGLLKTTQRIGNAEYVRRAEWENVVLLEAGKSAAREPVTDKSKAAARGGTGSWYHCDKCQGRFERIKGVKGYPNHGNGPWIHPITDACEMD
jgi:hypothetical protein